MSFTSSTRWDSASARHAASYLMRFSRPTCDLRDHRRRSKRRLDNSGLVIFREPAPTPRSRDQLQPAHLRRLRLKRMVKRRHKLSLQSQSAISKISLQFRGPRSRLNRHFHRSQNHDTSDPTQRNVRRHPRLLISDSAFSIRSPMRRVFRSISVSVMKNATRNAATKNPTIEPSAVHASVSPPPKNLRPPIYPTRPPPAVIAIIKRSAAM